MSEMDGTRLFNSLAIWDLYTYFRINKMMMKTIVSKSNLALHSILFWNA